MKTARMVNSHENYTLQVVQIVSLVLTVTILLGMPLVRIVQKEGINPIQLRASAMMFKVAMKLPHAVLNDKHPVRLGHIMTLP